MCPQGPRFRFVSTLGLITGLATLPPPAGADETVPTIVFRNVRVFDGRRIIPSATVLVRGEHIERVGPDVAAPDGARVVDGAGKTLLPGLFDCHVHTLDETQLRQAAVFGVTTVLDMRCDPGFAAAIRAKQAAGTTGGRADLLSAGAVVLPDGGPKPPFAPQAPTIAGPEHARAFVDDRIAEGSDYIKILCGDGEQIGLGAGPKLGRATTAAVIRAAHDRRKLAVAHVLELEDARGALADGVDGLVHLFLDAPADGPFLALAAERRPFVIPTLTALESIMGRPGGAALADDPDLAPYLPPAEARGLRAGNPLRSPRGATAAERATPAETARRLAAAGVPVLAGTDAPSAGVGYGVSLHRELELLVAAGLSPAEALAGATALPARAFGLVDRGRIGPGLLADLVLLDGDPTADIRATRKIAGVWKRGRPIDRVSWRQGVPEQAGGAAAAAAPPAGSEAGLVSDFEGGEARAAFGAGWALSTDALLGGKSEAAHEVAERGADGSRGALRIRGRVSDRPGPRFAGVRFLPGRSQFEPANLSAKSSLSFQARGGGRRFSIMVFTQKGGFTPSVKTFVAGKGWGRHRFELKAFDGCDGGDITGVFLGATAPGEFELWIDDVRFD